MKNKKQKEQKQQKATIKKENRFNLMKAVNKLLITRKDNNNTIILKRTKNILGNNI